MIQCNDYQVPSISHSDFFSFDSYGGPQQLWKYPLADLVPRTLEFPRSSTIDHEKGLLPKPEAMRARQNGLNDPSNRYQRKSRPMVAAGIPEQWYDRLDQVGPEAGVIPFIDDDPPFHLQRPSSNEESTQAFLEDPVSSQFGGNSQPQPLSHSLLSRLELSENDPNTFRDIIDDLTVQNKSLKRQLKRYTTTRSISKEYNGLFEVRIHSLPSNKKRELEAILHSFTANVHSSQNTSGAMLATMRRQSHSRTSDRICKRSSPSPSCMQALDSAYASASTTRVNIPTVPNSQTRLSNISHSQAHDATLPSASAVAQPSKDVMILDKEKREYIVRKLEQLLGNDLRGFGLSDDGDESPLNEVQYAPLITPNAPFLSDFSTRSLDESESTKSRSNDDANAKSHQSLQTRAFHLLRTPVPQGDIPRRNNIETPQQKPSSDRLPSQGHPRAISSIPEPTLQSDKGWVYLNLLVNAAQLHTLNVTSGFVRKAIQDVSTKLVLSDDGCKVRWQGHAQDNNPSPKEAFRSATIPLTFTDGFGSVEQSERNDRGASAVEKEKVHEHSTPKSQDTALPVPHLDPMRNKQSVSRAHYKPMFAPRKRRSLQSHHVKDDQSNDSDSTSSSTTSCLAQSNLDKHNGPMIFLSRDPFFLDLSADTPDCNRPDRAPYGRHIEEPLGGRNGSTEMDKNSERRPSYALPTSSGEPLANGDGIHQNVRYPSLKIYDEGTSPSGENPIGMDQVELEASGIGGIQLEDNFAIEVKTEKKPHPPQSDPRGRYRRAVHDRLTLDRRPAPVFHHRQLISAQTTHLPPSPLPPPSYVYPTISSSSSSSGSESGDDILSDADSGSELEFRPLSLSPQMRMFLEGQEEASEPEEDDVDMDKDSD